MWSGCYQGVIFASLIGRIWTKSVILGCVLSRQFPPKYDHMYTSSMRFHGTKERTPTGVKIGCVVDEITGGGIIATN
jgi:hypothetical protein